MNCHKRASYLKDKFHYSAKDFIMLNKNKLNNHLLNMEACAHKILAEAKDIRVQLGLNEFEPSEEFYEKVRRISGRRKVIMRSIQKAEQARREEEMLQDIRKKAVL